jgi:hypothetical protein
LLNNYNFSTSDPELARKLPVPEEKQKAPDPNPYTVLEEEWLKTVSLSPPLNMRLTGSKSRDRERAR